MGRTEMMGPSFGRELVQARVDGLHAEARRDGRTRRERRQRRSGLRLVLGTRLVSVGHRLLGEAAEVR